MEQAETAACNKFPARNNNIICSNPNPLRSSSSNVQILRWFIILPNSKVTGVNQIIIVLLEHNKVVKFKYLPEYQTHTQRERADKLW